MKTRGSDYGRFWNAEFYCTGREEFISECRAKTINISNTCKKTALQLFPAKVNNVSLFTIFHL